MFRFIRRSVLLLSLLAMLAGNVLLLTSTAFNAAISGALAATLGVRTVSSALSAQLNSTQRRLQTATARQGARSAAVRRFGKGLTARTRRVATRGIAAIPAESIPYIGAAVVVSSMAYELYEACQTLRELDGLYSELGLDEGVPPDTMTTLCKPLPLFAASDNASGATALR